MEEREYGVATDIRGGQEDGGPRADLAGIPIDIKQEGRREKTRNIFVVNFL